MGEWLAQEAPGHEGDEDGGSIEEDDRHSHASKHHCVDIEDVEGGHAEETEGGEEGKIALLNAHGTPTATHQGSDYTEGQPEDDGGQRGPPEDYGEGSEAVLLGADLIEGAESAPESGCKQNKPHAGSAWGEGRESSMG